MTIFKRPLNLQVVNIKYVKREEKMQGRRIKQTFRKQVLVKDGILRGNVK